MTGKINHQRGYDIINLDGSLAPISLTVPIPDNHSDDRSEEEKINSGDTNLERFALTSILTPRGIDARSKQNRAYLGFRD